MSLHYFNQQFQARRNRSGWYGFGRTINLPVKMKHSFTGLFHGTMTASMLIQNNRPIMNNQSRIYIGSAYRDYFAHTSYNVCLQNGLFSCLVNETPSSKFQSKDSDTGTSQTSYDRCPPNPH